MWISTVLFPIFWFFYSAVPVKDLDWTHLCLKEKDRKGRREREKERKKDISKRPIMNQGEKKFKS